MPGFIRKDATPEELEVVHWIQGFMKRQEQDPRGLIGFDVEAGAHGFFDPRNMPDHGDLFFGVRKTRVAHLKARWPRSFRLGVVTYDLHRTRVGLMIILRAARNRMGFLRVEYVRPNAFFPDDEDNV